MTDTPAILPMTPSDPAKVIERAQTALNSERDRAKAVDNGVALPSVDDRWEPPIWTMCACPVSAHPEGQCPKAAELERPQLLRIPTSFRSVEDVLGAAGKMNLPHCVVIAETESGALVLLDSGMTMAHTNWLIDRLKALMLAPDQPIRPK